MQIKSLTPTRLLINHYYGYQNAFIYLGDFPSQRIKIEIGDIEKIVIDKLKKDGYTINKLRGEKVNRIRPK
jgi:hypothetical protein